MISIVSFYNTEKNKVPKTMSEYSISDAMDILVQETIAINYRSTLLENFKHLSL